MKRLSAIIFLAILVSIAGCRTNRPIGQEASQFRVRIGYLPIYVDLPLFVAAKEGLFAKRGVAVELSRFIQSPDLKDALINKRVEVAASVATSVVLSSESRDPGRMAIFLVDSETPKGYLDSFVVMPKSGIRTLSDLKGKRLGVFPGPTAVTFCELVLERNGINPRRDLKEFTQIDGASHISALTSGTVDAVFTYEPTGTQLVMDKGARKILSGPVESQIINPWQAGVWVVSKEFVRDHPQDAKAIILAIYDAVDLIREDPSRAKAALADYTSVRSDVAQATPNIPFAKLSEADFPTLQHHADICYQRGITSKRVDVGPLVLDRGFVSQ